MFSYNLINSYYRNTAGKYVVGTTGSTTSTSAYSTTVSYSSSNAGQATHYNSYPGAAVRTLCRCIGY